MEQILHSKPWITAEDISKVAEVLASSMLGQGNGVRQLERSLAAWFHAADGVAVGSGSAGILLALHGIGVEAHDEVILPTYVCRSVVEAVLAAGARPVFCDVGPDWVITASDASRALSSRTRAVVVPHMYGIFADINEFRSLGVSIIEDCAQAVGAKGARVAQADVTVLSFHPTKCFTAAEGGMVLSSNSEALARMRSYRDGNGDYDAVYSARLFSPLSDVAAGLAFSQLDHYELGLARRREISAKYLAIIESSCPAAINHSALGRSMFFRFPLHLPGGLAVCQDDFAKFGVQVRRGVDELLHRRMGLPDTKFPNAVKHFETTVSLPIYPALTDNQMSRCIEAAKHVLPRFH
jgi:UDP-4-amino-4-deoxy-L-arabinose-oxoglutarate aminotransferase